MMPTDLTDVKSYLKERGQLVDRLLEQCLPSEEKEPCYLHTAMRYSVMAGGKRVRPILALTAFEYCGGNIEGKNLPIYIAAAALEMVHTYSLIHDDLPCMDDDDLRRGIPTSHKKFGEATAVLAGDALHVEAFALMARTGSTQAVAELAQAIGTGGMIGGQIADVEAEGRDVDRDEIISIHTRKTAALIRCSVRLGAILAQADDRLLDRLTVYGEKIGLAFQIIDDILDIEGDQKLLGKKVGSDSRKQKATYPGAVGLKRARLDASLLVKEAVDLFDDDDDNMLKALAQYIGKRQY
ncbi:MAG: polyprenyl synthetase family protein [bacterium]